MRKGTGLSDNQRTIIAIITGSIVAGGFYMAGLPAEQRPPAYVFAILGFAAIVSGVIERQLGIRDSTTSAVAKMVKPELKQYRKPSASQINGLTDD